MNFRPGCFLILAAVAAPSLFVVPAQADVVITFQDVGPDLHFDFSGSLNVSTLGGGAATDYATVSLQSGVSPVFYSASFENFAGSDANVTHTPGAFATNLPSFSPVQGTSSGTSLLFRLNDGSPGPATSLDLSGDWGAENAPIDGQLILTGQSAAGIGMVDGWNAQTTWGSITFQATTAIPEPSAALFLCGTVALIGLRRRRRTYVS